MKKAGKIMKRKILFLVFVVFVVAGLLLNNVAQAAGQDKWVIYWYICGSDLESQAGYATYDLMELQRGTRCSLQTLA